MPLKQYALAKTNKIKEIIRQDITEKWWERKKGIILYVKPRGEHAIIVTRRAT